MLGQLGTVSGVGLEKVLAQSLQTGDKGGHFRRALDHFPFPSVADEVYDTFFVESGVPFRIAPTYTINPSRLLISLTVCANFAIVWLAKEGHDYPVSINYLEKIAMPHIYAITGAMLAGVDYITMGAGIPLQIPDVIDAISDSKSASYRIPVVGVNVKGFDMKFNASDFFGCALPQMKKPGFIPIIASNLLSTIVTRELPGRVYGFVVEEPTAGGHNAPPRRDGIYGAKDIVDYKKLGRLGIPFWIGGAHASPDKLDDAISEGAMGIQAGSIFALSDDSSMDPEIRRTLRRKGFNGELGIRTDMRVSPTGFPFKVAILDGTIAESDIFNQRVRLCNQGALVTLYERPDGLIGYRCASEPIDRYVAKGGKIEDTEGRGCICNGLLATAGLDSTGEVPIVTLGDDVSFLRKIMASADDSYTAKDAIDFLLGL
jgi:NAD(P)H-dependent flavin oxidoreductase YrpB (nitropropane dioxygenase family)